MTQLELPDLEQTLGDIVLELLRAPQTYPDLILSAPLDGATEFSSNSLRITHHYTDALLAYGYTPEQPELFSARQWFSTAFPNGTRNYIDQDEMNRLEALLRLNPLDPYIEARLQRLVTQRDGYGRFNIRVSGMNFGTLLSVKVLYMAHQCGALKDVLEAQELKQYANMLVNSDHPDKDLALALRLRYEMYGSLTLAQRKLLYTLIDRANERGGAWDVPDGLVWAVKQMREGYLTVGEVADLHNEFHDVILSTCYVIENLAPLMDLYPEISPAIHSAMAMWWRMFAGEEALDRLKLLFPLAFDYLMVLSRTLVAVHALYAQYSPFPLMHRCSPYLLRRLAQQRAAAPRDADEENIRKALRKWLLIELDGKPQSLKLGVSGADVVRVKPDVRSPLDENARLSLPDSLVVKSGSIEAITKERDNYQSLPKNLRGSFVAMPRPSYIDRKTRRAYVIMSDLHQFWTLYEAARDTVLLPNTLSRELGDFLIDFHRAAGGGKRTIDPGLLRDLYLMPMQGYVRQIFPFLMDYNLLTPETQQQTLLVQDALYDLIGALVRKPLHFEALPVAYMHGDLHSRNIMLRKSTRNGHYKDRLEFKLIDLEKLRRDGDAALDLGELLSDLEILSVNELRQRPNYDPVLKLAAGLEKAYLRYARDREDTMFSQRLSLARAWAMLRFAKGNTRRGLQWLQQKRTRQARNTADEVLHFTRRAFEHLQKVAEVGY
jgi:hypothetical protein